MLKAKKKLNLILKKCKTTDVIPDALLRCNIVPYYFNYTFFPKIKHGRTKIIALFLFGILYKLFAISSFQNMQCFMKIPVDTTKVFRKPETCDMCFGITKVQRIKNISKLNFDEVYARTGIPVVISDGATNWAAVHVFNFDFFKQLYINHDGYDETVNECQFFPYKTEFKSLPEVFNMSKERARLEPNTNPWYVGWSNCNNRAGRILRQYYTRPYFLPKNSENIALSWIFIGGPGNGAHMHVDNVLYPSWQAQLKGRKLWYLVPPPECIYQCDRLSVILNPGEILVVDTNRWYHQTVILHDEISITIGSEFD